MLLSIGILLLGLILLVLFLIYTTSSLHYRVRETLDEHSTLVEALQSTLTIVTRRADMAEKQLLAQAAQIERFVEGITRNNGMLEQISFLQSLVERYSASNASEASVAHARIMALLDPLAARRVAEAESGGGPFIGRGAALSADGFREMPVDETPVDTIQDWTPSVPPRTPSPNGSVASAPRPHVEDYEEPGGELPPLGSVE